MGAIFVNETQFGGADDATVIQMRTGGIDQAKMSLFISESLLNLTWNTRTNKPDRKSTRGLGKEYECVFAGYLQEIEGWLSTT